MSEIRNVLLSLVSLNRRWSIFNLNTGKLIVVQHACQYRRAQERCLQQFSCQMTIKMTIYFLIKWSLEFGLQCSCKNFQRRTHCRRCNHSREGNQWTCLNFVCPFLTSLVTWIPLLQIKYLVKPIGTIRLCNMTIDL